MYIVIDGKRYTRLRDPRFMPECDLTGTSLPISEFEAEIVTTDALACGRFARLYDDLDNLWAEYWIVYAERERDDSMRVRAQSRLALLERMTLPAVLYDAAPIQTVLGDAFNTLYGGTYYNVGGCALDASFEGATLTGFCPEQTARARLQWVCCVIGAYVKDWFGTQLRLLPIPEKARLIPQGRTFMWPRVSIRDPATEVRVKTYTYSEYVPPADGASGEGSGGSGGSGSGAARPKESDLVEDANGVTYLKTEQETVLTNDAAPQDAAPNAVTVEGVLLAGPADAGGILTRTLARYGSRMEVSLDCVNSGQNLPGERATAFVTPNRAVTGVIERCDYRFGTLARATLKLVAAEEIPCETLTLNYTHGGATLGTQQYTWPSGYSYDIEALWVDMTDGAEGYIYRPAVERVTGTMPKTGPETVEVPCEPLPRAPKTVTQNGTYLAETDDLCAYMPVTARVRVLGSSVTGYDEHGNLVTITGES